MTPPLGQSRKGKMMDPENGLVAPRDWKSVRNSKRKFRKADCILNVMLHLFIHLFTYSFNL